MRSTCGACSDTQEPIRGISNARREDREGRTRITNNHCLAYNCAANVHEEANMTSDHAHAPDASVAWKHDGVRVVPADQLDPNTAQTPGMNRKAAINFARVGAQKLWAGTVHIHPDAKTGAHHHGHLESVIYIVKGRARMRWGEQPRVHRRGRAGRLHLHPAVRAAPGDQRQRRRDARVRALPQRRRGGGGEPRHRAGREARDGALDRSDPSARLR